MFEETICTSRLRLEPIVPAHAAALFDALQAPALYAFIPQTAPAALAALEQRYARWSSRRSADGRERWLNYAVRHGAETTYVGTVQATLRASGETLLAYEIFPSHQRRGFAREACSALIERLFTVHAAAAVSALVDTRNEPSWRLLEALGFRRTRTIANADAFKGSSSDEFAYELSRAGWAAHPKRLGTGRIRAGGEGAGSLEAGGMIFQPEYETLERHALEALQFERLTELVERLRDANAIYRERLRGVATPRSLADLATLPFSTKADMRDGYPLGLLAVEPRRLARIHASSGTTGKPTIGAYTAEDLRIFGEVTARSLAAGGIAPGDMFQVAWGYGLFTGGLGAHGGCEALGACAIPASSGNTARQVQLMADLPVIGIGCTPSYALVLAERFRAENRRPLALKYAICGAEAWTREMRAELEELFGVTATNIYGLTEIIGPGVAQECLAKRGLHVQEDHFLAEIVDPHSGQPLADGERGELVLTTLTREAMPVLRYRTRDLTTMDREQCACGRTTARIDWFTGRVDDMLVIRGVNVFPSAIEEVLLRFPELSPNYRIFVDRPPNGLDTMLVEIEHRPDSTIEDLDALATTVTRRLADTLLISLTTRVVRPGTIERIEAGKAQRVIDRRTAT